MGSALLPAAEYRNAWRLSGIRLRCNDHNRADAVDIKKYDYA